MEKPVGARISRRPKAQVGGMRLHNAANQVPKEKFKDQAVMPAANQIEKPGFVPYTPTTSNHAQYNFHRNDPNYQNFVTVPNYSVSTVSQSHAKPYNSHWVDNRIWHFKQPAAPKENTLIARRRWYNCMTDYEWTTWNKMESLRENLVDHIRTENSAVREFMAEFIGTFFLLLIGTSANIQTAFMESGLLGTQLAWGFGFAFAVYLAASVSGAHLNPAISFAALFNGQLSPPRFLLYVVAQILGAFVGTGISYLGHLDDINQMDSDVRDVNSSMSTARLFTTFPTDHMTVLGCLTDQVIGTAILAGCLSLITDKRHRIPSGVIPLLAGLVMSTIAMTYGMQGFAINPARDFGPRLFLLCVGYGWQVFSAHDYYFWIPIIGPIIGALFGTWIYKLFVGIHGLNENIDITGGKPYPRDDRGYKDYSINSFTPENNLISFNSLPR
ncbi:major intrinsic protein domain-containing protein [Ditylenchus destructor]|uniref:Major intrinsic protein domain-containing protein n=1 Tax=Ditylenchus destructor TaxID=166010 RepID=A0AAD4NFI3_9BILA|nr:major intrinsic protein domain-containing protein [Ditylenchus destructor]